MNDQADLAFVAWARRVRYLLGRLDLAADRLWGHLVERKDGLSVPIRILENRRKVA